MWKTCPECGGEFYADEPWKKLCLDCWKNQKGYNGQGNAVSRGSDVQALRSENLLLKDLVEDLQIDLENLRREKRSKPKLPDGFSDNLRRIISLVHPDKHGGAQVAHDVTVYLLGLREQLEEKF